MSIGAKGLVNARKGCWELWALQPSGDSRGAGRSWVRQAMAWIHSQAAPHTAHSGTLTLDWVFLTKDVLWAVPQLAVFG